MKCLPEFPNSNFNTLNVTRASGSTSSLDAEWHVSVLIPARNEEVLLPRCLSSMERARRKLPPSVTTDIIVVDDGSTDKTLAIAEHTLRGKGAVISSRNSVVGKARALAAQEAIARCGVSHQRHWLANTDADCRVPETWLLDQLEIAANDVHAVAGVIDVDDFREHGPEVAARFRESYLIYPDGSHPHVHGANLGMRADAYLLAGGWSSLETAEDHDLWNRLRSSGATCLSLANLRVITSGRRIGRAPLGFAQALAAHNIENAGTPA